MKIFLSCLAVIMVLMLITACGKAETSAAIQASVAAQPVNNPIKPVPAQKTESRDVAPKPKLDINSWNHPINGVLKTYGIHVTSVELLQNDTYPVVHIRIDKKVDSENVEYYKHLLNDIACADDFYDFTLINDAYDQKIEVVCSRSEQVIKSIIVNGSKEYFYDLQNGGGNGVGSVTRQVSEKEVIDYLMRQVPEISAYGRNIDKYNAENKDANVKLIMRLDGTPDPNSKDKYARDYYFVYVGEAHPDHTTRFCTFLVRKDLKEILADDPVSGNYISLEEWRTRNR